jgi:hypothetical protein
LLDIIEEIIGQWIGLHAGRMEHFENYTITREHMDETSKFIDD